MPSRSDPKIHCAIISPKSVNVKNVPLFTNGIIVLRELIGEARYNRGHMPKVSPHIQSHLYAITRVSRVTVGKVIPLAYIVLQHLRVG